MCYKIKTKKSETCAFDQLTVMFVVRYIFVTSYDYKSDVTQPDQSHVIKSL